MSALAGEDVGLLFGRGGGAGSGEGRALRTVRVLVREEGF